MIEPLKPCLFCGGNACIEIIEPHTHFLATYMPDCEGEAFAFCEKCSASISASTQEEAIKKWNKRTGR